MVVPEHLKVPLKYQKVHISLTGLYVGFFTIQRYKIAFILYI